MPVVHWKLAGDHGRAAPMALFQAFQDVAAVLRTAGHQPPVVEEEPLGLGERRQERGRAPIAFGNGPCLEPPGHAEGQCRPAVPTRLVPQRASPPGVAVLMIMPSWGGDCADDARSTGRRAMTL
jgi:hypothetical protein